MNGDEMEWENELVRSMRIEMLAGNAAV